MPYAFDREATVSEGLLFYVRYCAGQVLKAPALILNNIVIRI